MFHNLEITTTQDEARQNGVKGLVYGKAGVGKTRLCATAPKPIILSAEGGTLSIAAQALPLIRIYSLEMLNSAYDKLVNMLQYVTICVDSSSEIADICLAAKHKATKDGRKAYGDYNQEIAAALRRFRDFPRRHVIFTAREVYDKNPETGMFEYRPHMPGHTTDNLMPYLWDEVWHMVPYVDANEGGKVKSALRTFADPQHVAKDRSGKLAPWETPPVGWNIPNLSMLFDKMLA